MLPQTEKMFQTWQMLEASKSYPMHGVCVLPYCFVSPSSHEHDRYHSLAWIHVC